MATSNKQPSRVCCLLRWLTLTCGKDNHGKPDPGNGSDTTESFAKGADVSWITEMEAAGLLFCDTENNETGNGMLWDDGKASENMAHYASLNNAGYDAVKAVFPDTKVIVHLQNGQTNSHYRWLFGGLKNNGGKWDVICMSLYPEPDNWLEYNYNIISNITDTGKPTVALEAFKWTQPYP